MQAVRPTARPADMSVPVSTIAPPMPRAIGSFAAVRPSGTEPKCKFYFSVRAKDQKEAERKLKIMKETFERA